MLIMKSNELEFNIQYFEIQTAYQAYHHIKPLSSTCKCRCALQIPFKQLRVTWNILLKQISSEFSRTLYMRPLISNLFQSNLNKVE